MKSARFGFSIRWQLIIGVAIVHLLLMSIFVLDLTSRQRTFLMQGAKERVLFQADVLAKSALPHVIVDDLGGLNEIVDAFARDHTIRYVMVTDPHGRVLSDSTHRQAGLTLTDARSRKVLSGPSKSQFLFENPLTVQAAAPISIDGRTIGWAWMGVDRTEDQRHLDYVSRAGLMYTLVAVLIGTIFAILLGNTITHGLRALLLGAKRLSQDRLDVPVPVTSNNEVGVVARAFNAAMERLARQRAELENEIAERRRAESALKRANASLARSNHDLERFAYAASHDLQEPLRTIKNFTSLLGRRYKNKLGEDADEFIGYIIDGAERMETLIRDLLAYSRAGRTNVTLTRVDCGRSLRAALNNLRGAIESSGASVTWDDLPELTANETEMVQLFQNLVGNAIKYRSVRQPEIHVSASRSEGNWLFEVRDNGIGVPEAFRERIFGMFQRLHGRDMPGSGIGLATCTRIIERHGGRIWVESEVDAGSTFKFIFPETAKDEPRSDMLVHSSGAS